MKIHCFLSLLVLLKEQRVRTTQWESQSGIDWCYWH